MASRTRRSSADEEEESYFVSMADMMVGLLFVFIILLMYFALQFQQKSAEWDSAAVTRREILTSIATEIRKEDPSIAIDDSDTANGVLHLDARGIFETNQYVLTANGTHQMQVIARVMANVLPCYTPQPQARCGSVGAGTAGTSKVEALFIEGHTDAQALHGSGIVRDNLDLSVLRATNTFREMVLAAPQLLQLTNPSRQTILSVSGFGEQRLLPRRTGEADDAYRARNRRIDFRILMNTPLDDKLRNVGNSEGSGDGPGAGGGA